MTFSNRSIASSLPASSSILRAWTTKWFSTSRSFIAAHVWRSKSDWSRMWLRGSASSGLMDGSAVKWSRRRATLSNRTRYSSSMRLMRLPTFSSCFFPVFALAMPRSCARVGPWAVHRSLDGCLLHHALLKGHQRVPPRVHRIGVVVNRCARRVPLAYRVPPLGPAIAGELGDAVAARRIDAEPPTAEHPAHHLEPLAAGVVRGEHGQPQPPQGFRDSFGAGVHDDGVEWCAVVPLVQVLGQVIHGHVAAPVELAVLVDAFVGGHADRHDCRRVTTAQVDARDAPLRLFPLARCRPHVGAYAELREHEVGFRCLELGKVFLPERLVAHARACCLELLRVDERVLVRSDRPATPLGVTVCPPVQLLEATATTGSGRKPRITTQVRQRRAYRLLPRAQEVVNERDLVQRDHRILLPAAAVGPVAQGPAIDGAAIG